MTQPNNTERLTSLQRLSNHPIAGFTIYSLIGFPTALDILEISLRHYSPTYLSKICLLLYPLQNFAPLLSLLSISKYLEAQYPNFLSEPMPSILFFKLKILWAMCLVVLSIISSAFLLREFAIPYGKFKTRVSAKGGLDKELSQYVSGLCLFLLFSGVLLYMANLKNPSSYRSDLFFKLLEDCETMMIYLTMMYSFAQGIWFLRVSIFKAKNK